MMKVQVSPGEKTPSATLLSESSGALTPTASILNAGMPLTIPSTFVNDVPGLATYQRLVKLVGVWLVMLTSALTISGSSGLAGSALKLVAVANEEMNSSKGKNGALPSW